MRMIALTKMQIGIADREVLNSSMNEKLAG
jgi:hypothetical protein